MLREGNDDQLRHCSPVGIEVMRTFDAAVNVLAPTNDRARSTIPPDRQRLHDEGQAELARIAYERLAVIPWMVCAYPTAAAAQEAQMSTWSYEEFVYRACLLDEPDPAAAWRQLAERQKRLCDRLTGAREVRIQTAAGTDLTLGRGRAAVGVAPRAFATCPTARCSAARTPSRRAASCCSTCPR